MVAVDVVIVELGVVIVEVGGVMATGTVVVGAQASYSQG